MKILAAGCLHGDLSQAKRLAEQAEKEKVDLVVIAGDFTFNEKHTPGLFKVFKEKGLNLAMIPGNHESAAFAESIAKRYGIKNLHGYYLLLNDVAFFGAGSAQMGIYGLGEDELFQLLKRNEDKIKSAKKSIMFTHTHPAGTKIDAFGALPIGGSVGVRLAIESLQPDIAISSNIHEAEGIEDVVGRTRVVSVGKHGRVFEV